MLIFYCCKVLLYVGKYNASLHHACFVHKMVLAETISASCWHIRENMYSYYLKNPGEEFLEDCIMVETIDDDEI